MNSKRVIRSMCGCAVVGLALAPGSAVNGQYDSDFEALNASAAGVILTGQDNFYLPPGTDSTDFLAYTYAGNALGIPQNPEGGFQFVAGVGPGGTTFARGQRDITWGNSGTWFMEYDAACFYLGAPPSANNIGSFSNRLSSGVADLIHLFSWVDVNTPTSYHAFFLTYDAAGTQAAQPGWSPGPEWDNLLLDNWYRFRTVLDLDANQIVEVSITDLSTGQETTVQVTGQYLQGGATGPTASRSGFRLFSGGSVPDNGVAFDNVDIFGCPEDINGDGTVNVLDLLEVLAQWGAAGGPADVNGDGVVDVLDLLAVLAVWGPC